MASQSTRCHLRGIVHSKNQYDTANSSFACSRSHGILFVCSGGRADKHPGAHTTLGLKLARTFAAQLSALKDYRSKGEQKMTVQHVNVADGRTLAPDRASSPPA